MKFSQALSAWGVPAGATVTAVSVALDKKCVTAPGSAIGSGSFNTKLNLNAGASINSGPTQTLSTTADTSWTTLAAGSNAALSGLSDSTLTHLLEVDILYTLSTTSSALTSTTWQIDWDNVVVTVTYTVNVPGAPGTPAGTQGNGTRQIALAWADDANNGGAAVTDHKVYIYDSPSAGTLLQTIDTASSSTAYTVASGLTPGTPYYFEVTAINSAGESAHSSRSAVNYPTAIQLLQAPLAMGTGTGGSGLGLSTSFTTTLGSFLVLVLTTTGGPITSVQDENGDSPGVWLAGPVGHDASNNYVQMFYRPSPPIAGTGLGFAIAANPSVVLSRGVYEYYDTALSLPLDQQGNGSSAAAPLTVSTSSAAVGGDEVTVTGAFDSAAGSHYPTGYGNGRAVTNSGLTSGSLMAEKRGNGAAIQDAVWPDTATYAAVIATFRIGPVAHAINPVLQAVSRASTY